MRYSTRVEEHTFRLPDGTNEKRMAPTYYAHEVATLAEAQGVQFLCPKCYVANGGDVGTHWCDISFGGRGVMDEQGSHDREGRPTRWTVSGTDVDDLTTQPSILILGGCAWHGFITNGEVA